MVGRVRHEEAAAGEPRGFDDYDLRLGDVMRGERATMGKSLLDVQRDLKIKATYIAAIEEADPSAFETPGFVAGYVRSYARYLGLDPDWAFRTFRAESGFSTGTSVGAATPQKRAEPKAAQPFGDRPLGLAPARDGVLSGIDLRAVGSLAILLGLIGVLGYGGYSVLTEIQKVQLVPVEQTPSVVADIDPLESAVPQSGDPEELADSVASSGLDRLYRPEALEVPVLVARDGPIATLDPAEGGVFADASGGAPDSGLQGEGGLDGLATTKAAVEAALGELALDVPLAEAPSPQVVADSAPDVVVFAVRPSWVRIQSAEGTTIYEKIMQEGDRFVLPKTEAPATLRTGESGAIYFSVNGTAYGPAGRPGAVTGGLELAASSLKETYEVADIEADTALARVVVELRAEPPELPGAAEEGPEE